MGKRWCGVIITLLAVLVLFVLIAAFFINEPRLWDYAREVSSEEQARRDKIVAAAVDLYGANEKDGTHKPIIDLYNSHTPLARGYEVKYDDAWCAAFGSAIAIQCGFTDIIPTECGCERQIEGFAALDAWEEDDHYLPLPGDYIFYHWGYTSLEDCNHWSEHVGIVIGTWGNWIKVIEGNNRRAVNYRWLLRGSRDIRGYGVPHYGS